MNLSQEYLRFISLLNENMVEYLIIGGYAVNYHGYNRSTGDIDIFVHATLENRSHLLACLQQYEINTSKLIEKDFLQPLAFHIGEPPFVIDILNKVNGIHFSEAFEKKIIAIIEGIPINFISLQDLKVSKLITGRHRDLDDLEHLPKSR